MRSHSSSFLLCCLAFLTLVCLCYFPSPSSSASLTTTVNLEKRIHRTHLESHARRHHSKIKQKHKETAEADLEAMVEDRCPGVHYGSVSKCACDRKWKFVVSCSPTPPPDAVAWGVFIDNIPSTGWGELTIKTSNKYPDEDQAFAAGYLEAAITHDRITQLAKIIRHNHASSEIYDYFQKQIDNIKSRTDSITQEMTDEKSSYWFNVKLVLLQLQGVLKGYNDHVCTDACDTQKLSLMELMLMNSDGDVMDIERLIARGTSFSSMSKSELIELISIGGHCSALIKWTGTELYAGHTTWDDYVEMIRIYKHYTFGFNHPSIKAKGSSHSSYPGFITSSDDYYILDTNLVIIETTLNILNEKLYEKCDPSRSVMAWVRNLVANRMATDGQSWIKTFSKYNSGTYNDQWFIVDYNKFIPGSLSLQPGTLWVMEQIPGYVESQDLTSILERDKYWASYNRPYFEKINEMSMYKHYTSKHGEMFSYRDCPRAKMFLRDHASVTDMDSMKRLMMQNNWKTDIYSSGCPGNAIASRFDIRSPSCSMSIVANGATDSKVTNSLLIRSRSCQAISGPPYNKEAGLEPFSWSGFGQTAPEGQPDRWEFPWVEMKPSPL